VPPRHVDMLWNMLAAPIALAPALFEEGRIVTDVRNPAAHDFAQMQMVYRRSVVEGTPRGLLIN